MTEPSKQLTGGDRWRQSAGFFGTLADQPPGTVLVKAGFGVELDLSHAPQAQQRQPQTEDHFVDPIWLPRVSDRQSLTLACTRDPPKRDHTW